MSLDAQILNAFLQLLETKAELFSERDRAELEQIITNTEDNPQKLADAIAAWCLDPAHNTIDETLNIIMSERLPGKGEVPEKKAPSQPELLNAIQRSKPKK